MHIKLWDNTKRAEIVLFSLWSRLERNKIMSRKKFKVTNYFKLNKFNIYLLSLSFCFPFEKSVLYSYA